MSATPDRALAALEVGRLYRRRELHEQGLGGDRQKGISYPAGGNHVLLFSGARHRIDYGYRDTWERPDVFKYFGEWRGPGDMTLTRGNAAIVDRSPNLYLFLYAKGLYKFAGRFRCLGQDTEPTRRDGKSALAIVFRLGLT